MSLLNDFSRPCVLLDKTTRQDGEGGYITQWTEGATFDNYAALNTSTEAVIAERQGVSAIYTGLVKKDVPIAYGDYYRDTTTGQVYRVTSNPADKVAPASASFDLKSFTAERTELPA